ncbi:uncharacterized protein LOC100175961 [Ciona intestinalis]
MLGKLLILFLTCTLYTNALICNDGYKVSSNKAWVLKYVPGTHANRNVTCPSSLGTPGCMRVEATGAKTFFWRYKARGAGSLFECISKQECDGINARCESKLRQIIDDERFDSVKIRKCRMQCCYTDNCNNQPL